MEVYSICPRCGTKYEWDTSDTQRTPDGGTCPAPSPDCPRCGYDVTGSNARAKHDLRWYAERDDVAGMQRLLKGNVGTFFGLLRPDVNERNAGGFTPLMSAAIRGNRNAAAFLMANGADLYAQNNAGETAVDIARKWGHPGVVECLSAPEATVGIDVPAHVAATEVEGEGWDRENEPLGLEPTAEVVANLWTFVRPPIVYEVALRYYLVSGTDEEKFAFLKALAPFDYPLAQRYPIPENFSVVIGGRSMKSLAALSPGIEYLDWFTTALHESKKSLPLHSVGLAGTSMARAPLQTDNLLHVHTFVEVDSQGRQIPKAENAHPAQEPAVLINRWAFADHMSGQITGLAGRAYLAAGKDDVPGALLDALAPSDYLLAPRFVRNKDVAPIFSGDITAHQALFDPVIASILDGVPVGHLDFVKETTTRFSLNPADARQKTTLVFEDRKGKVSAGPPAPGTDTAGKIGGPGAAEVSILLVTCPSCNKALHIPAKYSGQRGTCKHCGNALTVPQGPAA